MICVIATIEITEGRRDEFIKAFEELIPSVQAEDGCLEYAPWVDTPTNIGAQLPRRDHVVTVVEKWESLEALEKHLVTPHMVEFRKTTAELRTGITLQVLDTA